MKRRLIDYARNPWTIIPLGILTLLAFILFARTVQFPFLSWDDRLLIEKFPAVRSFTLANVWHLFTTYDPQLYIPLTLFSYQLQYAVWGLNAAPFHAVNVLLHIANGVLVFHLARHVLRHNFTALLVAILFIVHPLAVEPVAWVSGRKDVLAAFFTLASACAFLSSERKWKWMSVAFFVLALLSKVSAIALPVVLLLWIERSEKDERQWKSLIPFFLLSFVFGVVALGGKTESVTTLPLLAHIILFFKGIGLSVLHFMWPKHLSIVYPETLPVPIDASFYIGILVCCALCLVVWFQKKLPLSVFQGAMWFALFLMPTLFTFSHGAYVYATFDRYMYLPFVGILLLLGTYIRLLFQSPKPSAVHLGILALLLLITGWLATLSYQRVGVWKDSITLYGDALHQYPHASNVRYNYALELDAEGQKEKAFTQLQLAIDDRPEFPEAYNALGLIHLHFNRVDDAIAAFQQGIAINPLRADLHNNLARAYGRKEMYQEGLQEFKRAFELDPSLRAKNPEINAQLQKLK